MTSDPISGTSTQYTTDDGTFGAVLFIDHGTTGCSGNTSNNSSFSGLAPTLLFGSPGCIG